jgi:hypothetical protein
MAERRKGRKKSSGKSGRTTRGTAPSAPDIENLEKFEASDEAKAHTPSDVDAMGQDKRRQVVGHSYGPSRKSQLIFFVAVGAVLVFLVGGFFAAVAAFDQPPDEYPDEAPWSQTPDDPADAAEQAAAPKTVSGPCGEPGNAYPIPADSPCSATGDETDQSAAERGQPAEEVSQQ